MLRKDIYEHNIMTAKTYVAKGTLISKDNSAK